MTHRSLTIVCALATVFFLTPAFVFAENGSGSISDTSKFAWGENIGWVNFAPKNGDTYAGLVVTDTAVTGYAWTKDFGWINFSPTNSGQGVANDAKGNLSGKAWIANLGWLDLDGVVINSSGKFTGIAGTEGSAIGRISFDCDNCNVTTSWREASAPVDVPAGRVCVGAGCNPAPLPVPEPVPVIEKKDDPASSEKLPSSDIIDYVESYDKPLFIKPYQHGLVVYDFGNGVSSSITIPKRAFSDDITVEVSVIPTLFGQGDVFGYAYGGVKFNVVAKDSKGNSIHHFLQPLQITLTLPEEMEGGSDIGVYWYNEDTNEWILVKGAVISNKTATFSVDHLTVFSLIKASDFPQKILAGDSALKNVSDNNLRRNWFWFVILLCLLFYIYKRNTQNKKSLQK